MEAQLPAWVCYPGYIRCAVRSALYHCIYLSLSTYTVDLGGSLAVASRGLFATGVSTDLSG